MIACSTKMRFDRVHDVSQFPGTGRWLSLTMYRFGPLRFVGRGKWSTDGVSKPFVGRVETLDGRGT